MKNKRKGIIIFTKKIKDNDLFIKILSSMNEIDSGMVYGGNSSKKKFIFQNGYFIDYSYTKKNQSSPPIFTAEITDPVLGNVFNNKYKLNALLSILNLINLSIMEGQNVKGFYTDVEVLIKKIILNDQWIINYCEWLFNLLHKIGYQIDYKKNLNKLYFNLSRQEFTNIYNKNHIKFPHNLFIENKNINMNINYDSIYKIFKIFESIFLKNHLEDINYKMPKNYINFKNLILNRLQK